MKYKVTDVLKITKNSSIVAVEDIMKTIKIGNILNGLPIISLKRNSENDFVDLYVKAKKNIEFKVGDEIEVLENNQEKE